MFRQASLFGGDDPFVDLDFSRAARSGLSGTSWVEYTPEWLCGSDTLYDALLEVLDFRQRTAIPMYDRLLDEPRLTAWWNEADGRPEPHEVLADVRMLLSERFERHFDSIGFNLYRNQRDSVAWHADRHRHRVTDPVVAILSVGESRPFQMRQAPVDGASGASLTWGLGGGDLF
ncbi:MAG: alpha-ketoglutarate-dependent dioxygenase AlkB, partial [Actinomycetota bacterium]